MCVTRVTKGCVALKAENLIFGCQVNCCEMRFTDGAESDYRITASGWLLLRQAMQRAEPQHEIDGVNANDGPVLK